MSQLITQRELNRATLARQLLLERSELSPLQVIEHLVGLQAQTPQTWYVGLWTRIDSFNPNAVGQLSLDHKLVRIAAMRSTVHLLSARDALFMRALTQDLIERATKSSWGKYWTDLDLEAVGNTGRAIVEREPTTFGDLGKQLATTWPGINPDALAYVVRAQVALVQTPPRGVWGKSGQATHTSVESWLGKSPPARPSLKTMVLRYLGAFGPASVKDAQLWSGLTRLAEVFDALRPDLTTFHGEDGRELFDLPDAPRPDSETSAPVRFMYDYDNLFLSHADRTRVIGSDFRTANQVVNGQLPGAVLVDGFVRATWAVTKTPAAATITVRPLTKILKRDRAELEAEALRLLAFVLPNAKEHAVVVVS